MKIGVVKDLKQGEARVGMTPENFGRGWAYALCRK